MSKKIFGLFGTGGLAREAMPIVKQNLGKGTHRIVDIDYSGVSREEIDLEDNWSVYFVDKFEDQDKPYAPWAKPPSNYKINGTPCIDEDEFFSLVGDKYFNIPIGDSKLREKIANVAENYCEPMSIWGDSTDIGDEVDIHPSALFMLKTSVTSNVKIGKYFQCNLYSNVCHDCIIGDFVTFAPNVNCLGNVIVKDHVYIGAGAIIRNGSSDNPIVIGEGAVVGMGAVVTKSVPAGKTVVGIPARELEK